MEFEVADLDLASEGKRKIEWTERECRWLPTLLLHGKMFCLFRT